MARARVLTAQLGLVSAGLRAALAAADARPIAVAVDCSPGNRRSIAVGCLLALLYADAAAAAAGPPAAPADGAPSADAAAAGEGVPQTAPPTPAPESAVLFADTAETVAVPGPAAAPEDRLAALVVAARRLAAAGRHGGFGGVPPAADADADDGCGGGAWGGGGAGGGGGGADCAAGLQLRPLLQLRLRWRLLPPPPA